MALLYKSCPLTMENNLSSVLLLLIIFPIIVGIGSLISLWHVLLTMYCILLLLQFLIPFFIFFSCHHIFMAVTKLKSDKVHLISIPNIFIQKNKYIPSKRLISEYLSQITFPVKIFINSSSYDYYQNTITFAMSYFI